MATIGNSAVASKTGQARPKRLRRPRPVPMPQGKNRLVTIDGVTCLADAPQWWAADGEQQQTLFEVNVAAVIGTTRGEP